MDIQLNGQPHTLSESLSVQGLVEHLQLTNKRIAVEVNQAIVPRSEYAEFQLNPNDVVEIVHAIGGG